MRDQDPGNAAGAILVLLRARLGSDSTARPSCTEAEVCSIARGQDERMHAPGAYLALLVPTHITNAVPENGRRQNKHHRSCQLWMHEDDSYTREAACKEMCSGCCHICPSKPPHRIAYEMILKKAVPFSFCSLFEQLIVVFLCQALLP